jgi:hypothetical protein
MTEMTRPPELAPGAAAASRIAARAAPVATEPVFAAPAASAFPRTDRFAYIATIGQGGMGVIFRALDRELGHEVALKVLRARSPDAVARLKTEFRARADLHHPNLLQLLDLFVADDEAFFTMELVDAIEFLDWVWQDGDLRARGRLAVALAGVVSALDALHAAGWVHFDVKPANILVDRGDRAVLADFGLSTAIRSGGEPARDLAGAGTPDYMAPERRKGGLVTPASDLYSVGVVILEALTGSPNDDGGAPQADPLVALARRLMAPDSEARPSAREVIIALAAIAAPGPAAPHAPIEPPFVGRDAQLAVLAGGLARVDRSTTVVAHVCGPSGIGKTSLIRRFLDHVAATRRDAIVLRGRCHPYEQIAFGGVDRIVDGLAERIRDGELAIAGIAPSALAALVRLFPMLPWRAPPSVALVGDDRERRMLGIAALRELLARAAAARTVVMWVDDLHWIDDDTEEVLAAIGQVPNAMIVYSYRTDDSGRLARLAGASGAAGPRVERLDLALGALTAADLEALVRAVAPGVTPDACHELAAAAGGSPVFVRVLGRHGLYHARPTGLGAAGSPAALWNQLIDALPAPQRALFDAIAVAPGPVTASVVRSAAGVAVASPELRALEQLGIISRASGRGAIRIAPFHDQLRQVRLAHLDAAARARLHRGLAHGHEETASGDYEALVHHLDQLGDDARAGHYAVLAGDRAAASLAFGTAAGYYARAIEWMPDRAEPWELHRKLAECESSRGHAQDAGQHFERAAAMRAAAVGMGLPTTQLAVRAAEQLLRGGRITDGYRIMREVLATLRIRLPGSHRAALLQSLVLRARLVLRGRDPVLLRGLDAETELRLDALWMASTSLAHVNVALADVLLLHHVHAALDGSTPSRMLRLLTYEAASEVTLGSQLFDRRAVAMMERAAELVAETRDDYDLGWFEASWAAIAFFRAHWPETIAHAEAAERHLLRRAIGVAWERAVVHSYWLFALALTGDAAALDRRRQIALDDALVRRDPLAESYCRSGYTILAWLFRDDAAGAQRERSAIAGAVRRDPRAPDDPSGASRWPDTSFGTPEYHAILADCHIALYAGEVRDAAARVEAAWPLIERALLLRIQFVGVDLRFLRARCALAVARVAPDRRALIRIAERERSSIGRDPSPVARPYHALLGGLLAGAPELLADAERGFDELAMVAHAAAARFRRGELLGGRAGDRLCREAHDRLSAAGIARPERVIAMYAP